MSILLPQAKREKLVAITTHLTTGFSREAQKLFHGVTLANIILWVHQRLQAVGFGWRDTVDFEYSSEVPAGFGAEHVGIRVLRSRFLRDPVERLIQNEMRSPEITVIAPNLLPACRQRIICTAVPDDTVCHIMPLSAEGMLVDRGLSPELPLPPRLSYGNATRIAGPDGYRTVRSCANSSDSPDDIVDGTHRAVFVTYFFRQKPLAEE